MSTEIFKVGYPVFDIRYGRGKVEKIDYNNGGRPIVVSFNEDKYWYSLNGCHALDIPTLSFTEYDLINGGWSQDRSVLNQPKKGDLVYVRDNEDDEWFMQRFYRLVGDVCYTTLQFGNDNDPLPWAYYSFENPLLKEKE